MKKTTFYALLFLIITLLLSCSEKPALKTKWQTEIGPTNTCVIYPAITRVIALKNGRELLACDIETGELVWRKQLPARVDRCLDIISDQVIIGDETGALTAYELETGENSWDMKINDPFYSPVASRKSVIFCGAGASVYCIDIARKNVIWSDELGPEGKLEAAPVVSGDKIIVVFRGRVTALDADDGSELWVYKTGENPDVDNGQPATVLQGKVFYATSSGKLITLNEENGELLWEYPAPEGPASSSAPGPFAVSGKVAYPVAGAEAAGDATGNGTIMITCLATAAGNELWEFKTPSEGKHESAFIGNHGFLATGKGLYKINLNNGKSTKIDLPGEYSTGLIISAKDAYLVLDGKYLTKAGI